MDWLKKKKEEATQAANQAAAKLKNKRTAFKGEGNVLGGETASNATAGGSASAATGSGTSRPFKIPFAAPAPPPVSEEEKRRRREMQTKAAESRVSAWDKRVTTARQARMQKEGEQDNEFDLPPPPPSSVSSAGPGQSAPSVTLSIEEVKARELQAAQAQLGFNPYAAAFSSSTESRSMMNAIGTGTAPPAAIPPPPPTSITPVRQSSTALQGATPSSDSGAVYVLLCQEPPRAIAAAETIIKMLTNILTNPTEEKFRRIRLSNASIQTKLVAVPGATDLLQEAGFAPLTIDGDDFLVLQSDRFQPERVQSTLDRTEVALMQLQVDSTTL